MSRRLFVTVVVVAAAAACAGLVVRTIDGPVERFALDVRYEVRGSQGPSSAVAIVAIDDRSYRAAETGPPMPRRRQAEVVSRLTRAGAAVVAYNLALTTRTEDDAGADEAIVQALRDAPAAVVSAPDYDDEGRPLDALAGSASFTKTVRPGSTRRHFEDRDGTWVRFLPPLGAMHSFATVAAGQYRGTGPSSIPSGALIDFAGPAGTYDRIPFWQVLGLRDLASRVGGKVVVVADTSTAGVRLQPVPMGGVMAPGELQANAIATAIDGFPLRQVSPLAAVATTVGLALLGALSLLAGRLYRPERRPMSPSLAAVAVCGLVLVTGWLVAAQVLFNGGTVVELVSGLVALIAAVGLAALVAAIGLRRELRDLQRRVAHGDDSLAGLEVFGDYVTLHQMTDQNGEPLGSMGTVWVARHKQHGRTVALKCIDTRFEDDPALRARFVEEAKAAMKIEHNHLVPVHNVGIDGDVMFIEMRLLTGGTLASRLRVPVGDLADIAEILLRVARALDALHGAGYVHADVKPENVLFDQADLNHPYLADFGLAVRIGSSVTLWGGGIGTPAYSAPEQTAGRPVDRKADVYALAVMAFEALTGTRPFSAGDRDTLADLHRSAPRPSASSRNPRLPIEVDEVFRKGLKPDPEGRYAVASEFATRLREVLRNAPPAPASLGPDAPTLLD